MTHARAAAVKNTKSATAPESETLSSSDSLNQAQKLAVETIAGPVLVLAGPGSGKTRVLTYRIAYLIENCGVSPFNILAVTFTNKAAREMKERLTELIGPKVHDLSVGTFHSTCVRILRRDGSNIGLDSNFLIYDDDDQMGLIKQALKDLDLDDKRYSPRAVQSYISRAKSKLLSPQEYALDVGSYWEEIVARVYR
jgi:DNA helicase II / ATP-dependent DNA helicase PcrA